MTNTKTSYVARLHQDDLDRRGGSDEAKMGRFVDSDIELERLEKACSKAFQKSQAARLTGEDEQGAYRRHTAAYKRYNARISELEADWKRSGPMSNVYKSALWSYEAHDRVIAYRVDDARSYSNDGGFVVVLEGDRLFAEKLAAELVGLDARELLLSPIRQSDRAYVLRKAAKTH